MELLFNEKTKMKDFSYLAISNNGQENSMRFFNQDDIKGSSKTISQVMNDFYVHYPILKQLVVSFGEQTNERLGNGSQLPCGPKACYSTFDSQPKKVLASHTHAVIIDKNQEL